MATCIRLALLGLLAASAARPSGHPLRGCSLRHPAFAVAWRLTPTYVWRGRRMNLWWELFSF